MEKLGLDPKDLEFSSEKRKEFVEDPKKLYEFRKIIETDVNTIHDVTFQGSEMQKGAMDAFRRMMKERLAKKPEIADILTPSFAVGCRRLTPGPGYLEALVEDNVEFVSEKIASINQQGIILETGREVEVDVLVCATGFNTSFRPPFELRGEHGISLQEQFAPFPKAYLSVATSNFPNFFMMLGPNSAIGTGSLTMMIESMGDYITKCIRKLQKEDYVSMTVKQSRVEDFSDYCHEYFKGTVYMDECNSWYRTEDGKGARITALWPGSTLHCIEALRAPRWEDFEFESKTENKLAWLGNGWSSTQIGDGGDPAWYVKEETEDYEEYKRRPFSH